MDAFGKISYTVLDRATFAETSNVRFLPYFVTGCSLLFRCYREVENVQEMTRQHARYYLAI